MNKNAYIDVCQCGQAFISISELSDHAGWVRRRLSVRIGVGEGEAGEILKRFDIHGPYDEKKNGTENFS